MTQEFVSEVLGVSRQAVSKWENGTSDLSTSNLIAIARLCGVSAGCFGRAGKGEQEGMTAEGFLRPDRKRRRRK